MKKRKNITIVRWTKIPWLRKRKVQPYWKCNQLYGGTKSHGLRIIKTQTPLNHPMVEEKGKVQHCTADKNPMVWEKGKVQPLYDGLKIPWPVGIKKPKPLLTLNMVTGFVHWYLIQTCFMFRWRSLPLRQTCSGWTSKCYSYLCHSTPLKWVVLYEG